jgi:hypothetical protein
LQTPTDNSYWCIAGNSRLHLISWPGEDNFVAWQSSTADTFVINPFGQAIFSLLHERTLTASMLFDELSNMFELPDDESELLQRINYYLNQFRLLGLLESHQSNEAAGT